MNGRRSNIEIIADVLRMGRTSKTDILYGCDLSYYQLQKYLRFLVARGFLELDGGDAPRKAYKPTAAGEQLLSYIDEIRTLMGWPDRDADTGWLEASNTTSKGISSPDAISAEERRGAVRVAGIKW